MGQVVEPDHIAYFRYLFLRVFQQFASGVQAVLRDELREPLNPEVLINLLCRSGKPPGILRWYAAGEFHKMYIVEILKVWVKE